jgi:hypothetical protein
MAIWVNTIIQLMTHCVELNVLAQLPMFKASLAVDETPEIRAKHSAQGQRTARA